MLAKALRLAGQPEAAEKAEKNVGALMRDYSRSIGKPEGVSCSEIDDLSKLITAKYQ
jgi:hypothetical protein